jgi:hypothetical protein
MLQHHAYESRHTVATLTIIFTSRVRLQFSLLFEDIALAVRYIPS